VDEKVSDNIEDKMSEAIEPDDKIEESVQYTEPAEDDDDD